MSSIRDTVLLVITWSSEGHAIRCLFRESSTVILSDFTISVEWVCDKGASWLCSVKWAEIGDCSRWSARTSKINLLTKAFDIELNYSVPTLFRWYFSNVEIFREHHQTSVHLILCSLDIFKYLFLNATNTILLKDLNLKSNSFSLVCFQIMVYFQINWITYQWYQPL